MMLGLSGQPAQATEGSWNAGLMENARKIMSAYVDVDTGEQMSVYQKFECEEFSNGFKYVKGNTSERGDWSNNQGYTKATFTEDAGYVLSGEYTSAFYRVVYYKEGDNLVCLWKDYNSETNPDAHRAMRTITTVTKTETMGYRAGDLVDEVITKSGTLPQDGKHSDGYYYKFKEFIQD